MEETVKETWVGGICIRDKQVFLVHRINNTSDFNKEFFVFPGKEVSDDENREDALMSAFEDFSMTIKIKSLFYTNEEEDADDIQCYYLCTPLLGEPHIAKGSDEALKMEEGRQVFIPMWVPLDQVEDLIVYPETVKTLIIEALEEGD
jgi:hypothetical protein